MIKALATSIQGLKAMETRMAASANNLANVNTDGFKKDRVTLSETVHGGIRAEVAKVETPGAMVEDLDTTRELSNVDLAEEIAGTIPTKAAYSANLKMIQTQDELTGTLLSIKK